VKAGDNVEVLDGKDKGLKGTVAKVAKPEATKIEKKEPEKVFIKDFVRHDYTSAEFNTMQKELALKISALRAKENEKQAITKQLDKNIRII
jgi:ribosomal protein L24